METRSKNFISAVKENREQDVREMLEAKADPNVLDLAIVNGHQKIAKLLLDAKANPNPSEMLSIHQSTSSALSTSPLVLAAQFNCLEIIPLLLQKGAKVAEEKDETEIDHLMSYIAFDMTINGLEMIETDPEKIETTLYTIHLLLNHGATFNYPLDLYVFLCGCDQRHPYVLNSLKKLIEKLNQKPEEYRLSPLRNEQASNHLKNLQELTNMYQQKTRNKAPLLNIRLSTFGINNKDKLEPEDITKVKPTKSYCLIL